MMLYRLASAKYVDDLAGIGAKLFGGRWNHVGSSCLYASSSISLALLEKFVHANDWAHVSNISLCTILLENSMPVYHIDIERLSPTWVNDIDYTQWLGRQILDDNYYAAMVVPSAIVPQEKNWILNPGYKHYTKIKIHSKLPFEIDKRLSRWVI